MKIGILTFHKALNMGAALQASALLCYVQELGYDAEIIDFLPNNEIPNNSLVYKMLRYIKHLFFYKNYRIGKCKCDNFKKFYKNNYRLSKNTYYGDIDMLTAKGVYDILISGSDQILNTTLTGNSYSYYMTFDNTATKVSYASSLGRINISEKEVQLIKEELPKFSSLSFREKSASETVKALTGLEGEVVLDPVFLMDSNYWSQKCNEHLQVPEKYILVYTMENSQGLKTVVEEIRKEFKLPILLINGSGTKIDVEGIEDKTCGPCEFLRYFRDAELIITNSFHGTAFSLIFDKKLVCIEHSKRNIRLENLLICVDKSNCQVSAECKTINLGTSIIDAALLKDNLVPKIEKSKQYLKKALEKDC